MKKSSKPRVQARKAEMVAVFPELHVWPGVDNDPPIQSFVLAEREPITAQTGWSVTADQAPDLMTTGEVHDFVQRALTDSKFGMMVEIAAAHLVAMKALSDPWFRMDRYKTRVDEHVGLIWELAQEIFEANADRAALYHGARHPSRRAVGLEPHGRKWASGDRTRAEIEP